MSLPVIASEAKQFTATRAALDCFVAALLAMTAERVARVRDAFVVRHRYTRKLSGAPPSKAAALAEPDAEAVRWLTELTGAMPPPAARD